MIQDNQKNFSRLQMLIDAIVIAVTYVLAWMIRFIGPFAYSAVRALAFEEYMFALIFIIPGYLLLYQAFTLYEPLHMQGRRLVLANIIKANVLGLLLIVFSLYMMGETDGLHFLCDQHLCRMGSKALYFLHAEKNEKARTESEADDTGRLQPGSGRIY